MPGRRHGPRPRRRALAAADLARARYRCAGGRATARLTLTSKIAQAARARGAASPRPAIVGRRARRHFTLTAGRAAASAEGLLDRRPPAVRARLSSSSPTSPPSRRSRSRPAAGSPGTRRRAAGTGSAAAARTPGAGTRGRRRSPGSRSSTRTAPPSRCRGRSGPIAVPAGRGIYAVGVYEIVYWVGGRPDHQWQYVNAGTTGAVAAGAAHPLLRATHECARSSPAAPGSSARTWSTRCSRAATTSPCSTTSRPGAGRTWSARSTAARRLHAGERRRRGGGRARRRRRAAGRRLPPRGADRRPPRGRRPGARRDGQPDRHGHDARGRAAPRRRALRARLDRRRDLRRRGRGPDAGDRAARGPAPRTRRRRPRPRATSSSTAQLHGLSTLSLRLSNVYGPRQDAAARRA